MRVEYVLMMPNLTNWEKPRKDEVGILFWVWPTWIRVKDNKYWPAERHDLAWICMEMDIDKADLTGINEAYASCNLKPPIEIIGRLNEKEQVEIVVCEDCYTIPKNITLQEWYKGCQEVVYPFSEWIAFWRHIT